jgi:hypothetical protein
MTCFERIDGVTAQILSLYANPMKLGSRELLSLVRDHC